LDCARRPARYYERRHRQHHAPLAQGGNALHDMIGKQFSCAYALQSLLARAMLRGLT
jgi:hypothetical protein